MSTKRILLTILATGAVLATVGIGSRLTGAQSPTQAGVTIPYSGFLSDQAGRPAADGAYDFTFALYATETGGEPLWTETQKSVATQRGAFTVLLGSKTPLHREVLDGGARWLEVGVRGPEEAEYTRLSPRQELSAAAFVAPAGTSALPNGLSCWHTHWGETWSGSGTGLILSGNSDNSVTLYARDQSPNGGYGVFGLSEKGIGVAGRSDSSDGYGVYGVTTATSGYTYGVYGESRSPSGHGVGGVATATSGHAYGVYGRSDSTEGHAVLGKAAATSGENYGVRGESFSNSGCGVAGAVYGASGNNIGVFGGTNSPDGYGVFGFNQHAIDGGYAGFFLGNVYVSGDLFVSGAKSFKIDHPLDPAKRYLYHFAQEAPEVQNVYNGVVTLDANGEAVVTLSEYFSALNTGPFRYQLTPIGAPMPNLHIAQEVHANAFKIAGGVPGKKVSWEVTAVRNDPYMRDYPAQAEVDKPAEEKGTYLYPAGYGQPQENGLGYQRSADLFRQPPEASAPGRTSREEVPQ